MSDQPTPPPPPEAPPPPARKLPYERPVLRRLGSVHDVTGATSFGSVSDFTRSKPRG